MPRRAVGLGPLVASAVCAVALVSSGAAAAPLLGHVGMADEERELAGILEAAGVGGAELLPRVPLETTTFFPCPTTRSCVLGPLPPTEFLAFGIVPLYEGSVTMHVKLGAAQAPVFTCTLPGSCEALGTGAMRGGEYFLIGKPRPATLGEYVVWVTYE